VLQPKIPYSIKLVEERLDVLVVPPFVVALKYVI
jgi:hypothetical protein